MIEEAKPPTMGIPVGAMRRMKMYLRSKNQDNRGEGKRNSKDYTIGGVTSENENLNFGKTKEMTFDRTLLEPYKNNWRF